MIAKIVNRGAAVIDLLMNQFDSNVSRAVNNAGDDAPLWGPINTNFSLPQISWPNYERYFKPWLESNI
jgi:hypothetical protein